MWLSALRIDDGANTFGSLPLQRMPAPVWQRLRYVYAREGDILTVTGWTKQFTRLADSGNENTGVFCPECDVRIYQLPKYMRGVLAVKPGTLEDTS